MSKERIMHMDATVCYLKKADQVLMLKFSKKWGHVYAPPGGKFESGETPLDCIIREFKEETGLTLIRPRLQGISYWHDSYEGIIFVFVAEEYEGELKESEEGSLLWVDADCLDSLEQFEQNKFFSPYLFKEEFFEGKFLLDDSCKIIKGEVRKI